jgi:hypothetical protein
MDSHFERYPEPHHANATKESQQGIEADEKSCKHYHE